MPPAAATRSAAQLRATRCWPTVFSQRTWISAQPRSMAGPAGLTSPCKVSPSRRVSKCYRRTPPVFKPGFDPGLRALEELRAKTAARPEREDGRRCLVFPLAPSEGERVGVRGNLVAVTRRTRCPDARRIALPPVPTYRFGHENSMFGLPRSLSVRLKRAGCGARSQGNRARAHPRREAAKRGLHPGRRPSLRRDELPGPPVRQNARCLDSMAANGVYLKNALVTTSLCSPSRASILTGLYTFRHRVIDNNRPIPPGTIYFPQYLQKAGYATAFIGKWHMGGESDAPQPGWDHWVSFKGQGRVCGAQRRLHAQRGRQTRAAQGLHDR